MDERVFRIPLRLFKPRVSARWYAAALLIARALMRLVLFALSRFSPKFLPGVVDVATRLALCCPVMHLFRYFNAPLEKSFTVVHWEQRGTNESFHPKLLALP